MAKLPAATSAATINAVEPRLIHLQWVDVLICSSFLLRSLYLRALEYADNLFENTNPPR
jgi:hypothetical protein